MTRNQSIGCAGHGEGIPIPGYSPAAGPNKGPTHTEKKINGINNK